MWGKGGAAASNQRAAVCMVSRVGIDQSCTTAIDYRIPWSSATQSGPNLTDQRFLRSRSALEGHAQKVTLAPDETAHANGPEAIKG
jgi:hypothetical protein